MESILWFLIVGGLFFVMMRHGCGGGHGGHGKHGGGGGGGCGGGHGQHDKHGGHEADREGASSTVKDPVCDMEIVPDQAYSMVRKGGRQHYFCSEACAGKFNADPDRYAEGG